MNKITKIILTIVIIFAIVTMKGVLETIGIPFFISSYGWVLISTIGLVLVLLIWKRKIPKK